MRWRATSEPTLEAARYRPATVSAPEKMLALLDTFLAEEAEAGQRSAGRPQADGQDVVQHLRFDRTRQHRVDRSAARPEFETELDRNLL